jgi:ATP-dependent helicase/nuclease subunit A
VWENEPDIDTILPVKSSVSAINKSDEFEYYKTVSVFGESDAEKGIAYHKALELIDFYGDVDTQYKMLTESGALTESDLGYLDLQKIKRILSLDIFSQVKNCKLYKEVKFCHLVNPNEIGYESTDSEILIQGIIDLIAVNGNTATLIDYKLSKIEDDSALVKKYLKQMQLYSLAIEKSLGLKITNVYLVNILQEKTIKVHL